MLVDNYHAEPSYVVLSQEQEVSVNKCLLYKHICFSGVSRAALLPCRTLANQLHPPQGFFFFLKLWKYDSCTRKLNEIESELTCLKTGFSGYRQVTEPNHARYVLYYYIRWIQSSSVQRRHVIVRVWNLKWIVHLSRNVCI